MEIELLISILSGLTGLIGGTLINRLWNRGRALLVLQGFSTFIEESMEVNYLNEIENFIDESWYYDQSVLKKATITTLYDVYQTEKHYQSQLDEAIEKIDDWIRQIEKVINNLDPNVENSKNRALNATKDIVLDILSHDNMRSAIDYAIVNDDLHIENIPNHIEENLKIIEVKDRERDELKLEAFYIIELPRKAIHIGEGFPRFNFLKQRFQPYIKLLRGLDPNSLINMLKNILPIIEKQSRTCRHIHETIEPLLNNNKQWAARIRVENYGSFPLIIAPEAMLSINKNELLVDCLLLLEEKDIYSEKTLVSPIKGKYVLGAEKKVTLWLVTKYQRKLGLEMETRNRLLYCYNKEGVNLKKASVKLNIKSIGTIGDSRLISSNEIDFIGNLLFPDYPIVEDMIGH